MGCSGRQNNQHETAHQGLMVNERCGASQPLSAADALSPLLTDKPMPPFGSRNTLVKLLTRYWQNRQPRKPLAAAQVDAPSE